MRKLILLVICLILVCYAFSQESEKSIEKQLAAVSQMQNIANSIHPAWSQLYPICIVDSNQYTVYRQNKEGKWKETKKGTLQMTVPKGVQAAFPLHFLNNEIACVVGKESFITQKDLVVIFHEFVHCYQFNTCESKIKSGMAIARKAAEENNAMWELNYAFPYNNEIVSKDYLAMIDAAERKDVKATIDLREEIKEQLTPEQWEYLVWQEFKEGSARWLQNELNQKLGLEQVHSARKQPIDRVLFYEGGEKVIRLLVSDDPSLRDDFPAIWESLYNLN